MTNLTFLLPGLPGEDGRVSWRRLDIEYVRGRTLTGYLAADLSLELTQVHHVIVAGRIIRPTDHVTVEVPCAVEGTDSQHVYCGVEVSAFDAYIPARGDEIAIVPCVEGKNSSVILGVVGAVAGFYFGGPGGAQAGWTWGAALSGAMTGYALGSTVGSLITPKPRLIRDQDGPSSYVWGGTQNDDRAGVPKPILVGQRLVGGKRIGMVRRRPGVVPVRRSASDYNDSAPAAGSETLNLLLLIAGHRCEGPVGITDTNAPANPTTNKPDVCINGTHYSNFGSTQVEWRTGAPAQSVIRGFDVAANTYDLAVNLTELAADYTYTTVDEVDAFEVLLTIPGLVHTHDEKGAQKNSTVYRLEYRKVGTSTWHNADYDATRTLKANTRALRLETRRVEILPDGSPLPSGRYEIKLRWLSAEFTDPQNDLWHIHLTGVTEEVQESRNYEGESLLAVTGIATEQLNSIPTVTSVWRGYIPPRYSAAGGGWLPATWGVGTFAPPGKNPFWIALALMRDTKIGGGNEITDAEIDLASFEAAAPEADISELVEPVDGTPYNEPRHQFSAYIDQDQEAVDLIQQILSTARGTLIFSGNKWSVAVDKPGPITQAFGMGSILATEDGESSFNLQFKSERREVNTIEATFDDAAADWATESHTESIDNRSPELGGGVFVTEDDLVAEGLPILRRKLQFWGVDRRSQVARESRLTLRQFFTFREVGTFGTYTEALLAQAYDLIGLAHDTPQWSYSGRVAESPIDPVLPEALSTVMFDQPIPFETGTTYQLMVRFRDPGPDGRDLLETRTVADAAAPAPIQGQFIGLTVTTPFSRIPAEGDEWFFGPEVVKPVRIVEIDRDANDERTITFADYNESVYDVSGPITIPQYSLLPDVSAPPGAIPELHATSEIVRLSDGRRLTNILLQWTRPNPGRKEGPYKGARVDYSFDNASWTTLASVDGIEHRWIDAPHGVQIWFRVIPYSNTGRYNFNGAAYDDIIPEGYGAPSPVIAGLTGGYADGAFWLQWNALGSEYEYEVRQANPGDWKTSTSGFLWRGKTTRFYDESPDARSITYYARARDPFGNYSSAAVSFSVSDSAPTAPTITSVTRFKDGFKIKVTPPAGVTDIVAIHLHASQFAGFAPSPSNRVATPVGPAGGEFFFKTATAGVWYFKATCEDWLSQRMNDWAYSAEDDDQIVVIAPVNPGVPTLAFTETDVKEVERHNGSYVTRARSIANITWTHTDTVNPSNSLVGWQILIYDTVAGISKPLKDSVVMDPLLRAYQFNDVALISGPTAIAAVKAVYVDGVTSDYITSTGQVIPQETNPNIRDSNDRNIPGFGESFDSASLPTGVSVFQPYSLSPTAGELVITATSTGAGLQWNIGTWAAQHTDFSMTQFAGRGAVAIVYLKIDGGGTATLGGKEAIEISTSNGATVVLDAIDDGRFNAYRVPIGVYPADITWFYIQYAVRSGRVPVGTVVRVSSIVIGFESVDSGLDGQIARGVLARDQFGRDTGGGLYGRAPLRMGDGAGNLVVIEQNGVYYYRNEFGGLTPEPSIKVGRMGRFANYFHGGGLSFGSSSDIPEPTGYDRTRLVIEDRGNAVLNAVPLAYPVFRWLEAMNFDASVSPNPTFQVANAIFQGGAVRTHSVSGPWSTSAQAKSQMLLNLTDTPSTRPTDDAWYYVQDDGIPGDANDLYFRTIALIAIAMPLAKRANGSFYYADLKFALRKDYANLNGSQMDLSGNPSGQLSTRVRTRRLANGQTHYVRVLLGSSSTSVDHMGRNAQNIKANWYGLTWESGGSGTVACSMVGVEFDYVEDCAGVTTPPGNNIGWTWMEHHG